MQTFKEYIAEAAAKPLKWAADKRNTNTVFLKSGSKILYRMYKITTRKSDRPYMVEISRGAANSCKNVAGCIEFLEHMLKTANMGMYGESVPEMPKDVLDWLENQG